MLDRVLIDVHSWNLIFNNLVTAYLLVDRQDDSIKIIKQTIEKC